MAFELAGIPYFFDKGYAAAIGNISIDADTGKRMLCPSHLLHLDHAGKPLWYNGSLFKDKKVLKWQREWFSPQVWAASSDKWHNDCMLEIESHGGTHAMSAEAYGKTYESSVQEAMRTDRLFDDLIS